MQKRVYIHIPFCKYICSYCDFCKKYIKYQDVDKYLDYLELEIKLYLNQDKETVKSIYIGGGTPSALTLAQVTRLLEIVNNAFGLVQDYEFTFEANPDDVNLELMQVLTQFNVNRLSIGCQSFKQSALDIVGRKHTTHDIINAVTIAKKFIDNISIDLMFDLKNETLQDVEDNLDYVKKLEGDITHISYYGLIVEKNVIDDFYATYSQVEAQNNQILAEQKYYLILEKLEKLGFKQYEISNFAKPGYKSKHNFGYWTMDEYYGFGLSSSGYIDNTRYSNVVNLKSYYQKIDEKQYPIQTTNKLDQYDYNYEKIMLNLRTNKGIKLSFLVDNKIAINPDFLEIVDGYVKIKREHLFISNEVILKCIEQLEEGIWHGYLLNKPLS